MNVPIRLHSAVHPHSTAFTTKCACLCGPRCVFVCVFLWDVFLLYHLSLSCLHSYIHSKIAAYYLSLLCCPKGRPWDIAAQGAAVCRSELCCWPSCAAVATGVPPTAPRWRLKLFLLCILFYSDIMVDLSHRRISLHTFSSSFTTCLHYSESSKLRIQKTVFLQFW